MIKINYNIIFFTFFSLFFFSSAAFADSVESVEGITGFFAVVMSYLRSIADFFLVDLPNALDNLMVYLVAYLLKLKLEGILWSINFSMAVASTFLDMISYSAVVNAFLSSLPNDVKAIASQFAVFEALTMIIEALITRYVSGMIN